MNRTSGENEEELNLLVDHIRRHRGIDFSNYKPSTLRRRLKKRMGAVDAGDYVSYLDYLQASPEEFVPLLDTLFINVTGFFRDREAWDAVRDQVIPAIIANRDGGDIRVWSAGVASGEEAYSLAMLLADALGAEGYAERVKIFATDADEGALVHARSATYDQHAVTDVPDELRERYFHPVGERYRLRTELRRGVIFGRHDVLEDAPISHLDLLSCRNTLMYFNREAQGKVLTRFHFALRQEGYLFLGRSEMLLTRRNLFVPTGGDGRIFRKVVDLSFRDRLAVAAHDIPEADQPGFVGEAGLRHLAFESSELPELVVDDEGELVLVNAAARGLLRLTTQDVGRLFHELDISYKPTDLRGPLDEARERLEQVVLTDLRWQDEGREERRFDIRLTPLEDEGKPVAVRISYVEMTEYHAMKEELTQSRRELEMAYEELQSTNEELETTNEELQSTVEELETTNEELQSSNEELETMNEELQSTNVEMETVNQELQERTGELGKVNRYVTAILDSLGFAVVVLDADLNVRTWNREAAELWGVRREDVVGHGFLGLEIGLPVHELRDVVRSCVRGEMELGEAVARGHDRKGRPVEHKVTCVPLHEADHEVTGVIIMVEAGR